MAEIKCPNCGTLISLEQSELDSIVQQVRDEQFESDLAARMELLEADKQRAVELVQTKADADLREKLGERDARIAQLQAHIDSAAAEADAREQAALAEVRAELQTKASEQMAREQARAAQVQAEKDAEIQSLKSQLDAQGEALKAQFALERSALETQMKSQRETLEGQLATQRQTLEAQHELAVAQAVSTLEKERDSLVASAELREAEHARAEATLKEQLVEQAKAKDDIIAFQQGEIERMKDMKARLSTKMVGESLEQHCQYEFDRIRAVAFPNAYFEKDNDASQGTKGDFIFREEDEDGNEILSIMFEMKNEGDTNSVKKKNEDHFAKLDKDRSKKGCEYAILVSLLEPESELYNEGIVDVSHRYPKMYVVRPQFFIPIISLLRNAALGSLQYKRELALVRQQDLDITNFEHDLDVFKQGFFKNFGDASLRFDEAVKAIDKAISDLQKAKDKLLVSEKHLNAANNKLEGLSVKKLTRKNPTMKAKFDALKDEE